jgi:hypothetical protein
VLTVARARPVACATSAAVSAPSRESAASTFARVSPGAVRVDAADPFALPAARVRVRAGVGFVEVALRPRSLRGWLGPRRLRLGVWALAGVERGECVT